MGAIRGHSRRGAGLVVSAYAWIFDGAWKGAIRCGALMASLGGVLLFLGVANAHGWADIGNALLVALMAAGIGGATGVIFGAFLGWIAGPIFREIVQKVDAKASGTKR